MRTSLGTPLLIIIVVFLACVCAYLISESTEVLEIDVNITKVEHIYDTGFASYDRTIVYTNNSIYKLRGLEFIPLGNVTLTLKFFNRNVYDLVEWR